MALQNITLSARLGTYFAEQTVTNATASDITASASTVYTVEIDNSANNATVVYVKLYNNNAPTVGTTDPFCILRAPAGGKTTYHTNGMTFGASLGIACTTEAGTAGTTSPSGAVIVRVIYD
jgi:hypothetical protein